jgi:GTP:adenosylcobinamide-phosphate guanylyltransferase
MHAVVMAGGTPGPDDPLYAACNGRPKALLDIAGKPMAQWVLDALGRARQVENVVIVGLGPESGLTCLKPTTFMPDQGGLINNTLAGIRRVRESDPGSALVLLASSDIPGITGEMVDWRVDVGNQADADFDYVAVDRKVMEARYPGSHRSYVKIRGYELCGGDLNVARASLEANQGLWDRLVASRKSALKQAALLGYDTLFLVLTRQMTLPLAERLVSRRLGLETRVHLAPYAELAMDVDKPHQLQILREDLALPARPTS